MLFATHDKAFIFFDGLPLRGIYDNLKTAIDAVFVGKDRKFYQSPVKKLILGMDGRDLRVCEQSLFQRSDLKQGA